MTYLAFALAVAAVPLYALPGIEAGSQPPAPLGFADLFSIPGNARAPDRPLSFVPFVDDLRAETAFHAGASQPVGDRISRSSEAFRCDEILLTQLDAGGDFSPNGYVAFKLEYRHPAATVPTFSGRNGRTPATGACSSVQQRPSGSVLPGWSPDMTPTEDPMTLAMLVTL